MYIRKTYLDGKHSMIESIPKVTTSTIGTGHNLHSVTTIRECVFLFLLFGGLGIGHMPVKRQQLVCSFFDSNRCYALCRRNISSHVKDGLTMIFPIVLFSDDFDPSVSLVKANNRAIWIYILTFKNQFSKTSKNGTYLYPCNR